MADDGGKPRCDRSRRRPLRRVAAGPRRRAAAALASLLVLVRPPTPGVRAQAAAEPGPPPPPPLRCAPLPAADALHYRGAPEALARVRRELRAALDAQLPCASPAPVLHWGPGQSVWSGRNFGDELNVHLWAAMLKRPLERTPATVGREAGKLLLIGTIFNFLKPRDIVAGIGERRAKLLPRYRQMLRGGNATLAAVRGRYTLDALRRTGGLAGARPALGDPALFAPLLVPDLFGVRAADGGAVCALPHGTDAALGPAARALGFETISHAQSPLLVARAIARCGLVVSSSLHGLVFADALGVPSVLYAPVPDSAFKYWDYASGLLPEGALGAEEEEERTRPLPLGEDAALLELVRNASGAWLQPDLHAVARACVDGVHRPRVSFDARAALARAYVAALPMRRMCAYAPQSARESKREEREWRETNFNFWGLARWRAGLGPYPRKPGAAAARRRLAPSGQATAGQPRPTRPTHQPAKPRR